MIIEEPYSKAALLSQRLAVFSLLVAGFGLWGVHRGRDLLVVLASSVVVACMAILFALLAFVIIWGTGRRGASQAFGGLLLATVLLSYPAYLLAQSLTLPRLTDIATDLADPPSFSLSRGAFAARGGGLPPELPMASRRAQLKAYPQIQPILLDLDAPDAFDAALWAAKSNGWQIIEERPAGDRSSLWHIDAIASSFILGFPHDITIRLRPLAGQTRLDIRSVSRLQTLDLGTNPRNITNFEDALRSIVDKK